MSSAEVSSGHRSQGTLRAALAAALCLSAMLVLGCSEGNGGFRPLYGSSSVGGAAANEKLAAVDIAPIPGRVGQRIRNELIFEATGGGAPLPPEYRLEIAIRESVIATLVAIDANASGQVYTLDASYKLIKLSDRSVVAQGKSYGRAAFERVTSIFANVRAREDAENRAAKTIAEELRTRLVAQMSRTN